MKRNSWERAKRDRSPAQSGTPPQIWTRVGVLSVRQDISLIGGFNRLITKFVPAVVFPLYGPSTSHPGLHHAKIELVFGWTWIWIDYSSPLLPPRFTLVLASCILLGRTIHPLLIGTVQSIKRDLRAFRARANSVGLLVNRPCTRLQTGHKPTRPQAGVSG